MTAHLGLDVGATSILALVADDESTVLGRDRRTTPQDDGRAVTAAVRATVQAACEEAGVEPTAIASAGVGSVGPLDRDAGTVVEPSNLGAVERIELVDPLRTLLGGGQVALFNDAVAGAVGEYAVADRSVANMVYLTISTGIGAGAVVDGRVLEGHQGGAGEVGHVTVEPDGDLRCGCGAMGHWEAYCSGANITRFAAHLAEREDLETSLDVGGPDLEAADVFVAADDDPLAAATLEAVTRYNVVGVATLVQAYAPETLVVGGGVARANPGRVLDPLRTAVPDRIVGEMPTVERATFGEDSVALGALHGARERTGP